MYGGEESLSLTFEKNYAIAGSLSVAICWKKTSACPIYTAHGLDLDFYVSRISFADFQLASLIFNSCIIPFTPVKKKVQISPVHSIETGAYVFIRDSGAIDVHKNNFTEERYTGFNNTPLQG
jgi:hypothetical protein